MKGFVILLSIIFHCSTVEAKSNKPRKEFFPQKYTNVICKQKYIPMKIEQSLNAHLLSVKFTALRNVDNFAIKNVRGIKGVSVTKFQEHNQSGIQSGELITSDVELSDFSGLAYVVFDVSIVLDGVEGGHSIPVPVGKLSAAQKRARAKNIKEAKASTSDKEKEGTSAITESPKKYHEMQAQ